jgi:hypothetical protein
MHRLNNRLSTFGVLEVEDGVIIPKEVYFINCEWMSSDLLDDCLDNFIIACLNGFIITVTLLTTFTFLRCEPLPPVRASPTLFRNLSIFA